MDALDSVWIPLRNRQREVVAHTVIDKCDEHLARLTWYLKPDGYAARLDKGRMVVLHRVILGAPPGVEVDHVSRNRLDNRRCNLRLATDGENARNCKRNSRNTSGYKGVRFVRTAHRWGASVVFEGTAYWLGLFNTPEEAAFAYDFAAAALHREFAATNFQLSDRARTQAVELGVFLLARGGKRQSRCRLSASEPTPSIAA